jgi:hypothetical protein
MEENKGSYSTSYDETLSLDDNIYSLKYGLTPEFFEKILYYESIIKEVFDPQVFFELINLYSKAIGYYESLNDTKFIIYNQALNYLFDLPEAKKFMEGKDIMKLFRKKEIMSNFQQCEKLITEEKVIEFIENNLNEKQILNSINKLYNNDMKNQKNNLEKKIKEKRAKYKNKKQQKEEEKNHNEIKIEKINDKQDEKILMDKELGLGDKYYNDEEQEIKNEKALEDKGEILNIDNEKNNDKNEGDNINEIIVENNIDLKQSIKLTNKSRFSDKLSKNFDLYFNLYYDNFIKNIDFIITNIQDKSEKDIKQLSESSIESMHQIKDMEYIMSDKNNEQNYVNEIGNIIKVLKEEQDENIKTVLKETDFYLQKLEKKYLINNTLFKEKFKLDTTKLLNSFIFK